VTGVTERGTPAPGFLTWRLLIRILSGPIHLGSYISALHAGVYLYNVSSAKS
jgi:hypothetical protein